MAGRIPLWRWRYNPLRRATDRAEAWIVLLSFVAMFVGGIYVGTVAERAAQENFAQQRQERHRVQGVLLRDVPARVPAAQDGTQTRVHALVRWEQRDGTVRREPVLVEPDQRAGASVDVWLDERGAVVDRALDTGEGDVHAAVFGIVTGIAAGALVLCVRVVLCRVVDRHRLLAWEREWSVTGPLWSSGQA